MKIIHFVNGRCNSDSANGVDKTIYFLTRALAARGLEVHLISATAKEPIAIEGVKIHQVAPFKPTLVCSSEVRDLVDQIDPDLGHLHSAYVPENIGMGRYFHKKGIPYVVTPNGNCSRYLMKRRPWLKFPYKMFLEKPYLNRASRIHSVGDSGEIEHYGVKPPVFLALNGICSSTLPGNVDRSLAREIAPQFKDRFLFVFVGRLDIEQKGLDLLIEAVARLKKEGLELGVLLVGPSWKGSLERIQDLISKHGVSEEFHLHGPAYGEDKFSIVASSDAFIHASRWEGLPFAVVEAMAMEQLCVVTPAADPAGLIKERGAGIASDDTVEGIANSLAKAMALSSESRTKLIDEARKVVKEDMSWEVIAARVEKAYGEILNERNR